jgi:hypothetical protein
MAGTNSCEMFTDAASIALDLSPSGGKFKISMDTSGAFPSG